MNTTLLRPSTPPLISTALKRLERIDPYREWLDPESHPALLALITSGELGGYHDAVSAIRGARPENPHDATKWWAAPVSRAQLLNALLRRGSRAVVKVEAELDMPQGKAYSFLKHWRVKFRAHPRVEVSAIDPTEPEASYAATVLEELEDRPGYARLKVWGFDAHDVLGCWSPANNAYKLLEHLPRPEGRIIIKDAAAFTNLTRHTLAAALRHAGQNNNGSIYLSVLARLKPDTSTWLGAAQDVYEASL